MFTSTKQPRRWFPFNRERQVAHQPTHQHQNHDGLPQKAGVPQEMVNEIHGSWFDPSNPVVKYSGSLKNLNYEWMLADAEQADLV